MFVYSKARFLQFPFSQPRLKIMASGQELFRQRGGEKQPFSPRPFVSDLPHIGNDRIPKFRALQKFCSLG